MELQKSATKGGAHCEKERHKVCAELQKQLVIDTSLGSREKGEAGRTLDVSNMTSLPSHRKMTKRS